MNSPAHLLSFTLLIFALVILPTAVFTADESQPRIKRSSFFSGIKNFAKLVFSSAKDSYEPEPTATVNARKICTRLGVTDPDKNEECIHDLTHNFVLGSVLSLFGEDDHETVARRNRIKAQARRSWDSAFRKRSKQLGLEFKEALKRGDIRTARRRIKQVRKVYKCYREVEDESDDDDDDDDD